MNPIKDFRVRLIICAAFAVTAWAEQPALPIKGSVQAQNNPNVKGDRTLDVVLRLYDRQFGGTILFQERQTVKVDDAGIFVAYVGEGTSGGVPARITDQHATVWGEYSLSSAAFINTVESRQQITHRREDFGANVIVSIPTSTTLCRICGGRWPVFQGEWNVFNGAVRERGNFCVGSPGFVTFDTRPFLCSRD